MARNVFTTTIKGNKDIISDLDDLIEEMPNITKQSLVAQQAVVEEAIKANWISFAGGKTGDYVYDSIGKNTETGANGLDVVGMVGVFNVDSVKVAHNKVQKENGYQPMNAAQIAYWVEFGTSRLKIHRGRKKKNFEYNEEDLVTVSAKPFMSNAFYNTLNEQQDAFYETFNKLVNK